MTDHKLQEIAKECDGKEIRVILKGGTEIMMIPSHDKCTASSFVGFYSDASDVFIAMSEIAAVIVPSTPADEDI